MYVQKWIIHTYLHNEYIHTHAFAYVCTYACSIYISLSCVLNSKGKPAREPRSWPAVRQMEHSWYTCINKRKLNEKQIAEFVVLLSADRGVIVTHCNVISRIYVFSILAFLHFLFFCFWILCVCVSMRVFHFVLDLWLLIFEYQYCCSALQQTFSKNKISQRQRDIAWTLLSPVAVIFAPFLTAFTA